MLYVQHCGRYALRHGELPAKMFDALQIVRWQEFFMTHIKPSHLHAYLVKLSKESYLAGYLPIFSSMIYSIAVSMASVETVPPLQTYSKA